MLKEFTVKRSNWTGDRKLSSYEDSLLNGDGNMCCLGFYCKQAGVDDDSMLGKCYPHDLDDSYELFPEFCTPDMSNCGLTSLASKASVINDSDEYTLPVKEQMLIDLFKEQGITLTFID